MAEYKITWLEPTNRERVWLRRYSWSDTHKCEETGRYCNAMVYLGEEDIILTEDGNISDREDRKPPKTDPRWPSVCEACRRPFLEEDPYQLFGRQIYVCDETGIRTTLEDAPIGSCWDAWWISERRKDGPIGCAYSVGPDHRSLVVKLPGNKHWHIDSRCNNCGSPDDKTHFCWVRHGKPEDGTLHVDKNPEPGQSTCSAGAGSISVPGFHGFLHYGVLLDC